MLRKQILLLGKQKMFLPGVKNIFASRTQILRPKHMFPSLATPGNITRNIVGATMSPSLARRNFDGVMDPGNSADWRFVFLALLRL